MLRLLIFALLSAVLAACVPEPAEERVASVAGPPCPPEVSIPDVELERLIRMQLNLDFEPVGSIPLDKLQTLKRLHNDGVSLGAAPEATETITRLSGLACATELESLGLIGDFKNLRPLIPLQKLEHLSLYSDKVETLEPLRTLSKLKELTILYHPGLSDIRPLADLHALESLQLQRNAIRDIRPLQALKNLRVLYLYGNDIDDISALARLDRLEKLWLSENRIQDISSLGALPHLSELYLDNNLIRDLSPLVSNIGLAEGDVINLRANPLDEDATSLIAQLEARGVRIVR